MIAARITRATARTRTRLWVPLALGIAALTLVYGRLLFQARGAVQAARVAAANGDVAEATRSHLDALRAYVPGSPFERQALKGLGQIAADAARTGDRAVERRALEAVRAGLLGTRSLYVPYRSVLADANRRLYALDASEAFPPVDPKRMVIERPPAPGPAIVATLVALGGFAAWIGGIILFIRRGVERAAISASGSVFSRWLPSALFVVGFTLFLLGLRST